MRQKQEDERDREIERLKQVITAIMGRCADLLDSDQFNNLEALVDSEPTFDEAVKDLRAETAALTVKLEALWHFSTCPFDHCERCIDDEVIIKGIREWISETAAKKKSKG